ncbi:ThiF family adenylyltransferase [Delftia tsuruhatensis]|uniref:ThiF family adenylyltransferase n=1 Tax=Delftia tsuruhatensis TaxID=180282 RepID=UPI0030CFAA40
MTITDVALQERHLAELRRLVLPPGGEEGAAYVLFGRSHIQEDPWERRARQRFLSYDVVPIPPSEIVSASHDHITWSTASFVRLLKQAKDQGLVAGIVHSHPQGPPEFSDQDHHNEAQLAQLARNRNGTETPLLSVLLTGNGAIRAQAWLGGKHAETAKAVSVVGKRLEIHAVTALEQPVEAFARQALAFGEKTNAQLRRLRVGVVGCGGTGSATALLLARLGVGQIVLFDNDIVESTNLNRLHGAQQSDADAMRAKVEVLAREISQMGLGCRAIAIKKWIGDPQCRDALKSCDVIFGCTDDDDGRLLLNRLAYFYLIPVIDMGLAIEPEPDGGGVRELSGRSTVLAPGGSCLLCRKIVDPVTARDEDLKRRNPTEYERRKREAYVRGGGNPAPAVVTFTTATACMAVDELLQGLTTFRGGEGWAWQRVRRFDLMRDRLPGAIGNENCPICADKAYWGLGDVDPFLDRIG